MNDPAETIVIDLCRVRSSEQLLDLLGAKLELGGPEGNVPVMSPTSGVGWGRNWDALNDSLAYLDSGGIWGTSRKPAFPLRLDFINSSAYKSADPKGYAIFLEILKSARDKYGAEGISFEYGFI